MGEEYESFLSQFIPALLAEFRSRGLDKKCFFHVSDEPNLTNLEQYKRCKELIDPYLDEHPEEKPEMSQDEAIMKDDVTEKERLEAIKKKNGII